MELDTTNQQAAPVQNTPQEPLVSSPVSNQKGFVPVILGVIILLIIVAGGAYYLGTKNSRVTPEVSNDNSIIKNETPTALPQVTNTPQQTPTNTNTTTWQSYTSSVDKFTIKIPKDWKIDDHQGVFISSPGEVVFAPPTSDPMGPFDLKLALTTSTKGNPRFPYGTQADFNAKLVEPVSTGEGQRIFKTANIKVDGKDAMQYVRRALPGDPTEAYYAVFTWIYNNGMSYYFEFEPNEQQVNSNLKLYNDIISTIKFQ